jgi:hypothetical protein
LAHCVVIKSLNVYYEDGFILTSKYFKYEFNHFVFRSSSVTDDKKRWKAFIWQKNPLPSFFQELKKKRKITFETVGDQKGEKGGMGKKRKLERKKFFRDL